ncbi:MAG: carboxypeptidase regulatory-like domain-containing protein [Bryobacterales bacterium]|nr:carboxypeptidase regulatory-like domain-containing protein [Bryobacterales bacterium]
MRKTWILSALIFLLAPAASDAQATATLAGTVVDPSGAAAVGASVSLRHQVSGFEREAATDDKGAFRFTNVAFRGYELRIARPGFQPAVRYVELRSNLPVRVEIQLELLPRVESVSVGAVERMTLLDLEASGTRSQLSRLVIEKLPVSSAARGLESVLLGFPGFAANANGAIHPRGAHNQMTYVIDGMPISDQFSGQFATSIDPNLVETLELFTGNIPPEYGSKVSGVARVTTRSGFDAGGRTFGQLELGGGGFDTLSQSAQVGGAEGALGWFGSLSSVKTNRFLDSPSLDNLHNGGNAQRGSLRLDWQRPQGDLFRITAMGGRSSFQLANLRSQHARGQRQRRLLDDQSVAFGYVRVLTPLATFDSTTSLRATSANLQPSPGDIPVTAELGRSLATLASFNRFSWQKGSQQITLGLDGQYFPVSEDFTFGLTDPLANPPGTAAFNPSLLPFDLTRGGSLFRFQQSASGRMLTGFVRDRLRRGNLVLDLGLRLDRYSLLVAATGLQPRVGLAWHSERTGTVVRVSYNHNLQTPPNENLLLANSQQSALLAPPDVRRRLNGGSIPIQPQREHAYETGIQQSVGGFLSVDAAFYHKHSTNPQDNDNFLDTGIIFPTSLAFARVNGIDARIVLPERRGLSGYLSATHYRAIVTPPFTGGLFLASSSISALSEGPFVIDHDQALGISGSVVYRLGKRYWTSWQVRHDSGLVANPSDPQQVAADPDYFDQLPHVDLLGDPPRVRPRTIVDAALGYEHYRADRRVWELGLHVSNLTNRTALYSFQSVFVGTRVLQPFTASVRLRLYW